MNKELDKIKKELSCMDDYDPDSLTPDEANRRIKQSLKKTRQIKKLPIRESLGHILAKNIISTINVPSATNSAMDGYAINGNDIPVSGIKSFELAGNSFAGKAFEGNVKKDQCVRIMTGAVMPDGTDTVVMQEHIEEDPTGAIRIDSDTLSGANVRQAGEDITTDDCVLVEGHKLSPADIGLIASLGQAKISVYKNITVAFFSTGDELRSIGEELEEGMIYDSNRYTLYCMLRQLGVEIIDMGVVRDVKEDIERAFLTASETADVIISSGGVSVGDADYVKTCLESQGEMNFWKVAMKPGRPLTFGKINQAYFFGLPGNPVSVMVTFYQFVQPALKYLMGEENPVAFAFKIPCSSKLKKRPGRVEYQRGILEHDDKGQLTVRKTGAQGSGILRSMSTANCFIILPLDNAGIEAGDWVDVQPFYGIL